MAKTTEIKISQDKETKTIKHPKTGKVLFNESIRFQELMKVEYTVGPYAGMVESLPELKAKRLIKLGKAKEAEKKGATPIEEIQRVDTLKPKKDETGEKAKKD